MSRIRALLVALLCFALPASSFAQAPQLGPGQVFGNSTAAQRNGRAENVTAILDRALGSTQGSILERGASSWGVVAPSATVGLPWVSNGTGADPTYQVLPLAGGGTNANNASSARTNLGLAIGSNVEAWDNDLDCLAALATTGVIKRTGTGTCSAGTIALSDIVTGSQDTVLGYFGSTAVSAATMPNCTVGALQYATGTHLFSCSGSAGTVTTLTPGAGIVSSVTAACSQSNITTTGTISTAQCANAQSAASYAIQDSDRGKLIVYSNAGATAMTIAQIGAGSAFVTGWYTDIENIATVGGAGIITLTATTSQFIYGGLTVSSIVILPGQNLRITSDGTAYQVTNRSGPGGALQASPSNPAATSSATGVMMGLGGTCAFTPRWSTRAYVHFQSQVSNSTATAAIGVQFRFGTGGAPVNGAALTGTAVGSLMGPWSAVANSANAVTTDGIITGLTPNTALWLDLSMNASSGTSTMISVSCSVFEF